MNSTLSSVAEAAIIPAEKHNNPNTEYLLRFIDFFYAAIVTWVIKSFFEELSGATLQKMDQINITDILTSITAEDTQNKIASFLLMVGVFFFISDDWIDSRNSNARIGYDGYLRFYLDILIAFSAYGSIFFGVKRNLPFFLIFIAFTHILITFWLIRIKKECDSSKLGDLLFGEETDRYIRIYKLTNVLFSLAALVTLISFYWFDRLEINLQIASILIVIGSGYIILGEILESYFMPIRFSQHWSPSVSKKIIRECKKLSDAFSNYMRKGN